MKRFRLHLVLAVVLVVLAFLVGTRLGSDRSSITPEVLARDFVRVEPKGPVWKASKIDHGLHYLKNWGTIYTVRPSASGTDLRSAAYSYSLFAALPVYIPRNLAHLGVGSISASARTHEGLIRDLERALRTNGIRCALNQDGTATIMTLIEGYKPRPDQTNGEANGRGPSIMIDPSTPSNR